MPITKATPNVISPISTTNLANSIVLRDASGNFSAGTITAALTGNASTATTATTAGSCTGNSATATTLQTARTIALTGSVTGSASFDGSANISIATTGGGGGATSAKAWVNFNAYVVPATINSSYNVSSVTKNADGIYTINFTSALSNANYSTFGLASSQADMTIQVNAVNYLSPPTTKTTTAVRVNCASGGALYNPYDFSVMVFGN